ncbi:MAG: hypothetical protein KF825_10560 [Ferruginibacter sp.]|nr:hypothetical protein [Ferruginibacter sp.]
MKKTSINQEILLNANCGFFKRDWCELNSSKNNKALTQKEQVIQLCWNGIMPELLPELYFNMQGKKQLTLWEINETGHLLDLRYGQYDMQMNDEWSINPYVYLSLAIPN